jgi:hypothetical protein
MNFDKDVIQYLANLSLVKNNALQISQAVNRNLSKEDVRALNTVLNKLDNEFANVLLNQAAGKSPWMVTQRDVESDTVTKPKATVNKDGTVVIGPQEDEKVEIAKQVAQINRQLAQVNERMEEADEDSKEDETPKSAEELKMMVEKAKRTEGKMPIVKRAKE